AAAVEVAGAVGRADSGVGRGGEPPTPQDVGRQRRHAGHGTGDGDLNLRLVLVGAAGAGPADLVGGVDGHGAAEGGAGEGLAGAGRAGDGRPDEGEATGRDRRQTEVAADGAVGEFAALGKV